MSRAKESMVDASPTPAIVANPDQPLPDLLVDHRYRTAMVIDTRDGIPGGVAEIDLSQGGGDFLREQPPPLSASPIPPVCSPGTSIADNDLPSISVVVPTLASRTEDLELLLDGFARVDYPDVEFILVDNRRNVPTPDPLADMVGGRPGVRIVREPRPGISAARNAGVGAADSEIIAFTDDDVRVDPLWLQAIGRRFALDPDLEAVTGLILPAELETPAQIWFERYYGGFSAERTFAAMTLKADKAGPRVLRGSRVTATDIDGHAVRRFSVYGAGAFGAGANMAFRRGVLQRLGGFDLALGTGTPARGGEDLAATISILWSGGKVGYEPTSIVYHRHRRELDELLHQLGGNGLGFTAMLTSLVSHDSRHALGLAWQLPLAVWQMLRQTLTRIGTRGGRVGETDGAHQDAPYPRKLVVTELLGYPKGPAAYLRSRRAMLAWSDDPDPSTQERIPRPSGSGGARPSQVRPREASSAGT